MATYLYAAQPSRLEYIVVTVNVRYMVVDVDVAVAFYTTHLGLRFRNDIVTGHGGSQILVDDSSGNPIELFQPAHRP